MAQGYHFSRPVPADRVPRLLDGPGWKADLRAPAAASSPRKTPARR